MAILGSPKQRAKVTVSVIEKLRNQGAPVSPFPGEMSEGEEAELEQTPKKKIKLKRNPNKKPVSY